MQPAQHKTLAYWHHPRFSSYGTSVRVSVKPLWDDLYAAGEWDLSRGGAPQYWGARPGCCFTNDLKPP